MDVTLEGSFIAGAVAGLVSGFNDPGEDILRKNLTGLFKTMETFGDVESAQNKILGANNIVFFTDRGASVFRIEENVTVDTFAPDFNLINNMTQKQFVTRRVRRNIDNALIGITVPSAAAGVGLVRGFLIQELEGLVGEGKIARYQDQNGNERPLDPDADINVFRDSNDSTLYHLLYAYFLRDTIKRIFGLFAVNTTDFGLGRAA